MSRESFVFAHLADAHVGAWSRNDALRGLLRSTLLKALEHVGEVRAEFLLVSGDLFHTAVPDPAEAAPVVSAMRNLVDRGVRIYAIFGSHDYMAHRTSWLDVLSEAGTFVRVAPDPVRPVGERWALPYVTDEPTGARIAGISGRQHGLDREYYRGMDASAFLAQDGFHVFQFHAGVRECLPPELAPHLKGIGRDDLPAGCAYYAGGHVHSPYVDEGPGGGLLVNPGALFGTRSTDLEARMHRKGHQGLAIVRVLSGRPRLTFFDPFPYAQVGATTVDVTGKSPDDLRSEIERVRAERPVENLVLRYVGTASAGETSTLGWTEREGDARADGPRVYVDRSALESPPLDGGATAPETDVEREELARSVGQGAGEGPELSGENGLRVAQALLRELATDRSEGESLLDYQAARTKAGLALLSARTGKGA